MTDEQVDPRWVQSGWGHRVASQDELLRAVFRIGSLQGTRRYVWRGVTDARWRIRSSLLRYMVAQQVDDELPTEEAMRLEERAILREARKWGLGLGPTGFSTDLHLLATLQHHGAPTRLLDVTTNPMTALWFACQRASGARDAAGALFAFDVTDVPSYETLTFGSPTYGEVEDPAGWSLRHALAVSTRDHQPFLVRPTLRDARMQAQEGLFIAGALRAAPSPPAGLEGLDLGASPAPGAERLAALFAPEERAAGRPVALPFCAVVIPPTVKSRVLPQLEGTYDRRYATLFPDVDGYAQALRQGTLDLSPPAVGEAAVFADRGTGS